MWTMKYKLKYKCIYIGKGEKQKKQQQQKKMYQGCSEEKNGILIPFGSISNNLSMT